MKELSGSQSDLLREIGNIGAGNAATAISTMLDRKVEITVPSVKLMEISRIPFVLPEPESIVTGVRMGIKGDIEGDLLLILDSKASKIILRVLLGMEPEDITNLDEMSRSALREIGNIMCGTYASALADFMGFHLDTIPPDITIDMVSAIISEVSLGVAAEEDMIIFIETNLKIHQEKPVEAYMFLIPKPGYLSKIFERMGVK
ncbi:MAG: chemotaxis protein CheC [Thermotoga sp.]|nr:MAG: chemotaxis protein CheC [Thermotoga sp.]